MRKRTNKPAKVKFEEQYLKTLEVNRQNLNQSIFFLRIIVLDKLTQTLEVLCRLNVKKKYDKLGVLLV
jgi:hypothetical protein